MTPPSSYSSPKSSLRISLIDLTSEDNEIISTHSASASLTENLQNCSFKITDSPSTPTPVTILLKQQEVPLSSAPIPPLLKETDDILLTKIVNIPVVRKQAAKIVKKTLKTRPHPITIISSEPPIKTPTPAVDRKCPICLDPLIDPSVTLCGHVYCTECIKSAAKTTKLCPICRTKLTAKSFHRLYL